MNLIISLLCCKIDTEKVNWGFKEIRYTQNDLALQMWLEIFPDTQIIFSIRNPFDVIKSMILAWVKPARIEQIFENPESPVAVKTLIHYANRWNETARSFQYWLTEKENWCCCADRYEDLIKSPEQEIEKLFNFLAIPMPDNAIKPMFAKTGKSPNRTHGHEHQVCNAIYFARQEIWELLKEPAEYFEYSFSSSDSFKK